ncbi:hypothetical protein GCM10009780_43860 [Actinomadura alba]
MAEPINPRADRPWWLRTRGDSNVNVPYELHLLRRRFPTVTLWFGHATRHFWAVMDDRLIEAQTPHGLASAITDARVWPPRERRTLGSACSPLDKRSRSQLHASWMPPRTATATW